VSVLAFDAENKKKFSGGGACEAVVVVLNAHGAADAAVAEQVR
jgi:hypothetical protein